MIDSRRITMVLVAMLTATAGARAERIKDICDIQGIRSNPLWGYGLVIGLNGTGDDSETSRRALANILRRGGMRLDPNDVASDSIASVIVTADLPPFGRRGAELDVTVSAIGSASSLQGGTLLMTPLVGADGQVYAVAQGAITLGGFTAAGDQASVQVNHPTVGRIPAGANIEREALATFVRDGRITLQLRNPDFTTADRIASVINRKHPDIAWAPDAGTIHVSLPGGLTRAELSGFVDGITSLEVEVDTPALVVINERTGTIIVGQNVGISTVAISHGNLSIITEERDYVSQPRPFAEGETVTVRRTDIEAIEEAGPLQVVPRQVSVSELARALNAMGATPRDLIAIFEALRRAGALQAKLEIM